jgi:dihydrofolate synthase/folylpolyglutamate synthase
MHTFQNLQDFLSWLDHYVNVEAGYKPSSMRPERMTILCALAGNPQNCAPSIHVAGSKGKGTVISMVADILAAAGKRVCLYQSPHVADFRERIMVNNAFLPDDDYMNAADEVKAVFDALGKAAAEDSEVAGLRPSVHFHDEPPTYFELLTLFYFCCARQAKAEVLAVETGLGGRLDPTNVVTPLVSLITVIELEHTDYLGDTIPEIACEKAGIIKAGRPVVVAAQNPQKGLREPPALTVFREKAADRGSRLYYMPEMCEITDRVVDKNGTSFTIRTKSESISASVKAPGAIYADDAAQAILGARLAFPELTEEAIHTGLARWSLPARFEKVHDAPVVVIDGAHTARSASLTADTFTRLHGEDATLLFGCAKGKHSAEMAQALLPRFSSIIITSTGDWKPSDPSTVLEDFMHARAGAPAGVPQPTLQPNIATALKDALNKGKPVLVCGSFYLAAEVRRLLVQ